jgi:hypothetical protein
VCGEYLFAIIAPCIRERRVGSRFVKFETKPFAVADKMVP